MDFKTLLKRKWRAALGFAATLLISGLIDCRVTRGEDLKLPIHFPAFAVATGSNTSLPVFSKKAYRAEFHYLRQEFQKIDLHGKPVRTDGWTSNIAEAEWPVMEFAYFGYACANFAQCDPMLRADALQEMRWLIDALQTPRLSGFVAPHFGEPFGTNGIHVAVFLHGHFLNLALRYREVSGDPKYDPIINQVASALTREYLGTNGPVLGSYRNMWWITDNFPAIAALNRYEALFKFDTSAARTRFMDALKTYYTDRKTGLFSTYINPITHTQSQGPRGISVMYGLHFLKDMDAAFAKQEYQLAKNCFVRNLFGLTAVREFPEGSSDVPDIDSGPVILGLGPSASGFAIAAAAVNDDTETAWNLLKASALVGLPEYTNGNLRYAAMPTVGQAVILFGKSELMKAEMGQRPN